MKLLIISLLFFIYSCNSQVSNQLPVPEDSFLIKIIQAKYTSENQLDGSEFATVDTVIIKEKIVDADANTGVVKFHIHCSYQAAALPDRFEKTRPDLNTDTLLMLEYKNKQWIVSEK